MMISIWDVLSAVSPILAPLISLFLVVIGRIIWNHEQRLRSLEASKTRHGRTLYGDEDDVQQDGLSSDIGQILSRLDRLERKVDTLNRDTDDSWDNERD